MAERMPALLHLHRERYIPSKAKQAQNPAADPRGSETNLYAGLLRFTGVAEYAVEGDITAMRQRLRSAASCRLQILKRYDSGEPISPSYVSMLAYKALFDALAAGAWHTAQELARRMGGRSEIEEEHDHAFDIAMGYALKWFVLEDREQMLEWAEKFAAECDKPGNANFRGYARVFRAILRRDTVAANQGLKEVVAGHQKESRGQGVFKGTEDEVLCVWGVGMANLCRRAGMGVAAVPPLIPGDLIQNGS
jgi:hypothetical protein